MFVFVMFFSAYTSHPHSIHRNVHKHNHIRLRIMTGKRDSKVQAHAHRRDVRVCSAALYDVAYVRYIHYTIMYICTMYIKIYIDMHARIRNNQTDIEMRYFDESSLSYTRLRFAYPTYGDNC